MVAAEIAEEGFRLLTDKVQWTGKVKSEADGTMEQYFGVDLLQLAASSATTEDVAMLRRCLMSWRRSPRGCNW